MKASIHISVVGGINFEENALNSSIPAEYNRYFPHFHVWNDILNDYEVYHPGNNNPARHNILLGLAINLENEHPHCDVYCMQYAEKGLTIDEFLDPGLYYSDYKDLYVDSVSELLYDGKTVTPFFFLSFGEEDAKNNSTAVAYESFHKRLVTDLHKLVSVRVPIAQVGIKENTADDAIINQSLINREKDTTNFEYINAEDVTTQDGVIFDYGGLRFKVAEAFMNFMKTRPHYEYIEDIQDYYGSFPITVTRTSEIINDGSDGTDRYVELSEIAGFITQDHNIIIESYRNMSQSELGGKIYGVELLSVDIYDEGNGDIYVHKLYHRGKYSINNYAFYNDSDLLYYTDIEGRILKVGSSAFRNSGIDSMDLGGSVCSLGNHAFMDSQLNSILGNENVYAWNGEQFRGTNMHDWDVYPNLLQTINTYSFNQNNINGGTWNFQNLRQLPCPQVYGSAYSVNNLSIRADNVSYIGSLIGQGSQVIFAAGVSLQNVHLYVPKKFETSDNGNPHPAVAQILNSPGGQVTYTK